MKQFANIARILVGALFIFSGFVKLVDPIGTAIKFEEYFHVFSDDIASFFDYLVPIALPLAFLFVVAELVLGVAVLINYKMRISTVILLALIVLFTFLTFYSAYFNKVTDCGCFGDFLKLDPWDSFKKDVFLLILAGVVFMYRDHFKELLNAPTNHVVVVVSLLISSFIAYWGIEHLPIIDFRAYHEGSNIAAAMQPSEPLKYEYIMEKDGQEFRFDQYPTDKSYTYKDMELLNPEAQPTVTDYMIWDDQSGDDQTQASFQGSRVLIIIQSVEKAQIDCMPDIKKLTELAARNGIEPWVVTSSDRASYDTFRHEHQLGADYYFADATVLKAMIRANPGIMAMKDGTVLGKWHCNDVPDFATVKGLY